MQVQLTGGRVRGSESAGVLAFTGMPYARARRFELARPASWDGVLDATGWGPDAPQNPGESYQRPGVPQNEDCLRVNVWTPDTRGTRPVMFWIHGGAYFQGASSLLSYDGAELARRGDVVVVSINYRLGALGFASHPELARADGSSGNWGLLDQVEALRWVQREIAAFGGDLRNVTIFGESAGGASVTLLMTSASARGLFHKAICQSGSPNVVSKSSVKSATERLAAELGTTIAGLRDVEVSALLKAERAVEQESSTGMEFLPVLDGTLLEKPPLEVFQAGQAAPVPLLMGTNADEYRLYAPRDPHSRNLTPEHLEHRISGLVRAGTAEIIETYRRERTARGLGAADNELWFAIKTDERFRARTRRVVNRHSKHQPTYQYLFCYGSPAMGGWLGAAHGIEIPFVFGTYKTEPVDRFAGTGARADALCERMLQTWVAFARTGNPSTPDLAWPSFEIERKPTMLLDVESRIEYAPAEREIALLEDYLKT
jgi:para-nitrobenzyl esterase